MNFCDYYLTAGMMSTVSPVQITSTAFIIRMNELVNHRLLHLIWEVHVITAHYNLMHTNTTAQDEEELQNCYLSNQILYSTWTNMAIGILTLCITIQSNVKIISAIRTLQK